MKPSPALALAAANARLRGKPGRPRKAGSGHDTSTTGAEVRAERGAEPSAPRLLDLRATASYLGVSGWTVRHLEAAGVLRRVRIPLPNDGELRKLLFDREDLDRLIEAWKEPVA